MADVPVIVTLELQDGRRFSVDAPVEAEYADTQWFWWTEGNGSCDCNRSLYLNRQHGLNLGTMEDGAFDVPELPCGNTIKLVSLVIDGREQR